MKKRLLFVPLLLLGGCLLTGCAAAGPKDFDEAMVYVDKMREIAKEQGLSWYADVGWTGSPEVYERVAFGLNTGVTLTFHVQGNAKNEEPSE